MRFPLSFSYRYCPERDCISVLSWISLCGGLYGYQEVEVPHPLNVESWLHSGLLELGRRVMFF